MKMTKIISLLLVLAMLTVAITSCNLNFWGNSDPTTTTPTTPTTPDDPNPDPDPSWDELYDIITIAEAIEIANANGNTTPNERFYVRGTIVNVSNPAYGEMTIADETGEIYVYGTYSADGSIGYANFEDKPVKGDEVLLNCILNTYTESPQVKNARLIDFKKADKEDIDISSYTKMSVFEARDADKGENILLTGKVAAITYSNGKIPNGIYLIDGTESIYVHDGDIAGQVKVGNTVTVAGTKAYWVLDNEQSNAQKHGYIGSCQLESAILVENDNKISDIDFSWCKDMTVKEIINTPVTENITTTVFKTTALVNKVPGNGYVNYYINDLDGTTGSYVYTQCNGSDFSWLDEFDGKICTVYLSAINAKATMSDCIWRFYPVKVVDEGYTFDLSKAPEFAIEYHAIDQFLSEYTGNPQKELPTSVSSELLGFENVTLSYTSSNESVVYFTVENPGATVLNCGANGTATVTITATYGEYTHSETVEITVNIPTEEITALSIKGAIEATVGETILVEGIVGPSLVNKDGFYLIDENGVLAIIVKDSSVWEGLAIGQKVIIEGTRDKFNSGANGFGVTCVTGATIHMNYYGNYEYSTASFITDKTLDDFYVLDKDVDHSTEVYVAKGTVVVQENTYYSNIKLQTSGGNQITLYSSSSNQYGFLKNFVGQEVTVEIVPCNWNGKTFWAGCVIAVITEDGKIYNELNFTSNK